MSEFKERKGPGPKSFQQMKNSEYRALEHLLVKPSARDMFRHNPYSNDFGRIKVTDENTD